MNCSFLRREASKAHNGEAVANFSEVGGGAIQFDNSALRLPVNRVGFETFAVVQISDEDFFVLKQPNRFSPDQMKSSDCLRNPHSHRSQ
jgi:hypothetical protein